MASTRFPEMRAPEHLGEGTYGCVYKHAPCPDDPPGLDTVSKVVETSAAGAEIATMEALRAMDPDGNFSVRYLSACKVPPALFAIIDKPKPGKPQGNCISTKFVAKGLATTMLSMTNGGHTWNQYIAAKLELTSFAREVPFAALKRVVGTFASLVRALAFFHGHHMFHFDLNGGNQVVDSAGLGRLIDFGGMDFLQRLVLEGNYNPVEYPAYFSPFDCLPLAVHGIGKPVPVEDLLKYYQRWWDALWLKEELQYLYKGPLKCEFPRAALASELGVDDLRKILVDLFTANTATWDAALKEPRVPWGPLDVFAIAVTFIRQVNIACAYNRLEKAAVPFMAAIQGVLSGMVNLLTAARLTAAKAFAQLEEVCATFDCTIPPVPFPDSVRAAGTGAGPGTGAVAGLAGGASGMPAAGVVDLTFRDSDSDSDSSRDGETAEERAKRIRAMAASIVDPKHAAKIGGGPVIRMHTTVHPPPLPPTLAAPMPPRPSDPPPPWKLGVSRSTNQWYYYVPGTNLSQYSPPPTTR